MGISTSFYANLERGNKGVSISVLYDLANCLGVSVDYLIYPNQADARIRNLETLLRDKPESFIIAVELLHVGAWEKTNVLELDVEKISLMPFL